MIDFDFSNYSFGGDIAPVSAGEILESGYCGKCGGEVWTDGPEWIVGALGDKKCECDK